MSIKVSSKKSHLADDLCLFLLPTPILFGEQNNGRGAKQGSGQLAFVQYHGLFFFVISKTIFFGQSQFQGYITPLFFIFPHKLYFHERNRDKGKPNDSEPEGQRELTKADFLWLRHCSGDSGCWSTLSSASAQNSETHAHIHT